MNKFKKTTALLLLLFFFCSNWLYAQSSPGCGACLTNSLLIHTAYDHDNSTFFGTNANDQYWLLVDGPAAYAPFPKCAISLGATSNGIPGATTSARISVASGGYADGNMQKVVNNCNFDDTKYKFSRRFCVTNGNLVDTAILNMRFLPDNCLSGIRIIGPNGIFSPTISGFCYDQTVHVLPTFKFPVVSGTYAIEVFMGNDWSNAGSVLFPNWVQTAFTLQLECSLTSASLKNIFLDNRHFGKNSICSNVKYVYIDTPKFGNICIAPPKVKDTITITNYNNDTSLHYSISSGTIDSNGWFIGHIDSTYYVTVSDNKGCAVSTSVKIVSNKFKIRMVDTTLHCIQPGSDVVNMWQQIDTFGIPPFVYSCPTSFFVGVTSLYHYPVGMNYIEVKDSLGCVAKTTFAVGNLFDISLTSKPPCVNPGKISITHTPNPILSSLTYSVNGGAYSAADSFFVSAQGTYTVVAKDTLGCSNKDSIQIYPNPVVTSSYSYTCPPTFTALPAGLTNYTWTSANSNFVFTANGASNTSLAPCYFSNATNYTVTATDVHGCTGSAVGSYQSNPFCCDCYSQCPTMEWYPNAWNQTGIYKISAKAPYGNGNLPAILAMFNNPVGNVITTPAKILIDGTIFINQNVTFLNCPNMLFTKNGRFILQNGATLTINGCTLKSLCHDIRWEGIIVQTPNESVVVSNSTLKDMQNGILSKNGGKIRIMDNIFANNHIGVSVASAPNGFNYNGGCQIVRNTFTTDNINCGIGPVGEIGVYVLNSKEVEIGHLDNGASTNNFKNIWNGIQISSALTGQTEVYKVYDNYFENIHSNTTNENTIYSTWSGSWTGTAIYARSLMTTTNKHTLDLQYSLGMDMPMHFENCDKAVVGIYTSAKIANTKGNNCFLGFMFDNATNQLYDIGACGFGGTRQLVGIQINGNTNKNSKVYGNWIGLRNYPLANNWPFGVFPSGYNIRFNVPDITQGIDLSTNNVYFTANAGTGYSLLNTNNKTYLYKNIVYNQNFAPLSIVSTQNLATHFSLASCNGTMLSHNYSYGNNVLLTDPNDITGMNIESSKNCEFICNHFEKSRLGTVVSGNCSPSNFKGNDYSTHGNALRFLFNSSSATLGDIGNFISDNGNTFTNAGLFAAPMNFSIFRFVNSNLPGPRLYSSIYSQSISGTNNTSGNGSYQIIATTASPYQCPANKVAKMTLPENLEFIQKVIKDSMVYTEFEEGASWIDEGQVFDDISLGILDTLNNPDLIQFYNEQLLTQRDELFQVDELFKQLGDSIISEDSTLFELKLQEIGNMNNSILSDEPLELNEKFANKIYLEWLRGGISMIDSTDSVAIENLALSCPLVNGKAVYKARAVYASYNPSIDYNNYNICHSMGIYKGGAMEDQSNMGSIDATLFSNLMADNFKLYPNPATNDVTIDYTLPSTSEGKIVLYDVVGRARMTIDLSASQNRIHFSVANLETGIYVYKFIANNNVVKTGKLVVE